MSSTNYSWGSLYEETLAESNPVTKLARIKAAEDAIRERRKELVGQGDFCAEVYAAEEALMHLWLHEMPSTKPKGAA